MTLSQAQNARVQIRCLGRILRIVRLTDQAEYTCQVVASLDPIDSNAQPIVFSRVSAPLPHRVAGFVTP